MGLFERLLELKWSGVEIFCVRVCVRVWLKRGGGGLAFEDGGMIKDANRIRFWFRRCLGCHFLSVPFMNNARNADESPP